VTRVRRLVVGLGVASSFWAAVFRGLPRPRPVLSGAGAGVKSSSSASCLTSGVGVLFSSWSESSTTGAFRRVAAARVDFLGEIEAMACRYDCGFAVVGGRLRGVPLCDLTLP
jgi:hypothetical protein